MTNPKGGEQEALALGKPALSNRVELASHVCKYFAANDLTVFLRFCLASLY